MIEITPERLAELLKAENTLYLLKNGGVDDWDWYADSLTPEDGESSDDYDARVDAAVKAGTLTPTT